MYTVSTDGFVFEWDEAENRSNIKKHGISFEEAMGVFWDRGARRVFDLDHSGEEDRLAIVGFSSKVRLLVVCHCYGKDSEIRIFSARRAAREEAEDYRRWNP